MRKVGGLDFFFLLQLAVACFLITLGIAWLVKLPVFDDGFNRLPKDLSIFMSGSENQIIGIALAILEIASGVIVALGLFQAMTNKVLYFTTLIVFVFWVLQVLYIFVFHNLFMPNFLVWLNRLSIYTVIGAALWLMFRRYA